MSVYSSPSRFLLLDKGLLEVPLPDLVDLVVQGLTKGDHHHDLIGIDHLVSISALHHICVYSLYRLFIGESFYV